MTQLAVVAVLFAAVAAALVIVLQPRERRVRE